MSKEWHDLTYITRTILAVVLTMAWRKAKTKAGRSERRQLNGPARRCIWEGSSGNCGQDAILGTCLKVRPTGHAQGLDVAYEEKRKDEDDSEKLEMALREDSMA